MWLKVIAQYQLLTAESWKLKTNLSLSEFECCEHKGRMSLHLLPETLINPPGASLCCGCTASSVSLFLSLTITNHAGCAPSFDLQPIRLSLCHLLVFQQIRSPGCARVLMRVHAHERRPFSYSGLDLMKSALSERRSLLHRVGSWLRFYSCQGQKHSPQLRLTELLGRHLDFSLHYNVRGLCGTCRHMSSHGEEKC